MKTIVALILLAFSVSQAAWKLEIVFPDNEEKIYRITEAFEVPMPGFGITCNVVPEDTCARILCGAPGTIELTSTIAFKHRSAFFRIDKLKSDKPLENGNLDTARIVLTLYWE